MAKLTKAERELILRCAEIVQHEYMSYSCLTLKNELKASPSLLKKYRDFYNQGDDPVLFYDGTEAMNSWKQDWRLTALLFFAEAG